MIEGWDFNPPPDWPKPPGGWTPPVGWQPDPAWGPVPPGWQLWVPARARQRRRALAPIIGLGAVLAIAVLGAVVPRVDGPGAQDPRVGGTVLLSSRLPAMIHQVTPVAPVAPVAGTTPVTAIEPTPIAVRAFGSCAELNRRYSSGVGMPDAVDRTAGKPVTGFGRSTSIYRVNLRLDRDGDGIACEPR